MGTAPAHVQESVADSGHGGEEDQNTRDGHGHQVQRGAATAVGTAPANVQSVADSEHGDEDVEAVDDDRNGDASSAQQALTHDSRGYLGQDGRDTGPVLILCGVTTQSTQCYEREEKERDDIHLYRLVSSPYGPKLGKHFRPYPSQNQIFYFLQEGAKGLQRSRRGEEEI